MSYCPDTLKLLCDMCPFAITVVTDERLGDILDAWLADEFALADHQRIHQDLKDVR